MPQVSFAIIDIESSGLDVDSNMILEVGILLLDLQLNEVGRYQSAVVDEHAIGYLNYLEQLAEDARQRPSEEPWKGGKIVHEMHQKSGLAADIRNAFAAGTPRSLYNVEVGAVEFLRKHGIDAANGKRALPMVGSSVHFDRKFIERYMPVLNATFHYRNIDVSTIKGITDLLRADVVEARQRQLKPQARHRVIDDCLDTRNELAFYLNTYFTKEATSRV